MNTAFGGSSFNAWIVFQGADHRRFWRIFTKRGWRHCFVIIPAYNPAAGLRAGRCCLVVDARTNHIATDVVFMPVDRVVKHMLDEGATCVVKFRVDRNGLRDYVPRGFLTCVSVVKAICGISAWHVWTPEQLARWFLQRDGEMITKEYFDGEDV